MTDTAERIAKLAERLDPEPNTTDLEAALCWDARCDDRRALLAVATPGAQLGALVDLASHKFGPDRAAQMLAEAAQGECDIQDILAALLAAMEDL